MILKVVVDNNTYIDQYYCGEPAVSFYIEDEEVKILFDVGYSDLFLENAKKLDIDINDVNSIVISHGHNDHTRGLEYLFGDGGEKNFKIVSHPLTFEVKSIDDEMIGSPFNKDELKNLCDLLLTDEPMKLSRNITFLGEIPQVIDHEKREKIGSVMIDGEVVDDFVMDDSALVYEGQDGIYIITGCSHSGICNIVEYAKQITNCDNVLGIIGGFHLFELNEKVNKTIEYLEENNIQELYPCHCTSFKVKAAIDRVVEVNEVGVGLILEWK